MCKYEGLSSWILYLNTFVLQTKVFNQHMIIIVILKTTTTVAAQQRLRTPTHKEVSQYSVGSIWGQIDLQGYRKYLGKSSSL